MSRQKEDPVFNRVEELRVAKGLTRQQLADAVGVHYQTVGYLERGEYSPSLVLALRIAAALEACSPPGRPHPSDRTVAREGPAVAVAAGPAIGIGREAVGQ